MTRFLLSWLRSKLVATRTEWSGCSVLIFRQKARYLLFYTYPDSYLSLSTTLEIIWYDGRKSKRSLSRSRCFRNCDTTIVSREKFFNQIEPQRSYPTRLLSRHIRANLRDRNRSLWTSMGIRRSNCPPGFSGDQSQRWSWNPTKHTCWNCKNCIRRFNCQELLRSETSQSFMEKLQKARTLLSDWDQTMTDAPPKTFIRTDGRQTWEPRPINIHPGFIENANGSVLVETGKTRVICTASVEEEVPPLQRKDQPPKHGWLTAEYGCYLAQQVDEKETLEEKWWANTGN